MKNKLLTTTAIASLLSVANFGAANAQTTVTGNLNLSYKAVTTDAKGSQTKANSMRSFGKETQINITNKGKLNNGMDYVAGFSIEHDGTELSVSANTTNGNNMFSENVYMDFISGNTTLTIGADHIPNPDFEYINIVGMNDPDEVVSGVAAQALGMVNNAGSPYQAFGFGVIQTLPNFGRVSAYYTPDSTNAAAGDSHGDFNTRATLLDSGQSRYELGFRGGLGVKGLDAGMYYNVAKAQGTSAATLSDATGFKTGVKYTAGAITGAISYGETENGATQNVNLKTKGIGLGYAIDKNLSVGINRAVTERNVSNTTTKFVDEKITTLSIGYNLGAIAVGLSAGNVEGAANTTNQDGKAVILQLNTSF